MRILIVDNSLDPAIYRPLNHWWPYLDGTVDVYRPPAGHFPPIPLAYTHVIITGSEASITQDDDWIVDECELVQILAKGKIPVLASCFGHQMVVRALSGKKFVHKTPTPEFGWVRVELDEFDGKDDPVFGALPEEFHVYSSHFDEVEPLPEGWDVLGKSARCENAMIKWRDSPIWGIQHHPEIGFDDGERLIAAMMERKPDQRELVMAGFEAQKRDDRVTGILVRAFLDYLPEEQEAAEGDAAPGE